MAGLRKSYTSSSASTTTSGTDFKSTLSGSTSRHGPRFKRYRLQAQGAKEVPEEQITMVEDDVPLCHFDEEGVYFVSLGPGMAMLTLEPPAPSLEKKSGRNGLRNATSMMSSRSKLDLVRDFKFGGGEVLRSSYEVNFMAMVKSQQLPICASVVPGPTPFLLARPTLEDWKVKQNYETNDLKIGESPWFKPARGAKGHYLLNLLDFEDDSKDMELITEEVFLNNDVFAIEPVLESEATNCDDHVLLEVEQDEAFKILDQIGARMDENKKLIFFEVYVDEGNIATYLARKYPHVEVSTFGLPEWDLSIPRVRDAFKKLVQRVKPHYVWMAPPCRVWSTIQRLNCGTPEKMNNLMDQRDVEENPHLTLVKETSDICDDVNSGFAVEQPHHAASWDTNALSSINNCYDAVCNRCQTGLCYFDKQGNYVGKVKKPTRLRTNDDDTYQALNLPCTCKSYEHINMDGKSRSLKQMQNYEQGLKSVQPRPSLLQWNDAGDNVKFSKSSSQKMSTWLKRPSQPRNPLALRRKRRSL